MLQVLMARAAPLDGQQPGRLQPLPAQFRRRRRWCRSQSRSACMERPPQHLRGRTQRQPCKGPGCHARGCGACQAAPDAAARENCWLRPAARRVASTRAGAAQASAMRQARALWPGKAAGRAEAARGCAARRAAAPPCAFLRTGALDAAACACCYGVSLAPGLALSGPGRGGAGCIRLCKGLCVQPSSAVGACCGLTGWTSPGVFRAVGVCCRCCKRSAAADCQAFSKRTLESCNCAQVNVPAAPGSTSGAAGRVWRDGVSSRLRLRAAQQTRHQGSAAVLGHPSAGERTPHKAKTQRPLPCRPRLGG